MSKLTRSYVHGASAMPLVGDSVGQCFDRTVAAHGEREALVVPHQGIRWSWNELQQQVDGFAAGLLALGLAPGERIAIWAQNRAEWLMAQLAAAKAGLILVNINPAARRGELQQSLNRVGARALIVQEAFKTSDYLTMVQELAPELSDCPAGALRCEAMPALELVIHMGEADRPGMLRFDDVPGRASDDHRHRLKDIAPAVQFDDPANIQFSSATGRPAGATLSHHNIVNNGLVIGRTLRLSEADRVCIPVPLFHCFGMVIGNMACLTHGSTMIYPAEAFDPARTLATIAEERCTAVYGVPAMFIAMLDQDDFASHDLSSLRTGVMAGAPCPVDTMEQVRRDMHMSEVTIAYGMTETSPVTFMSDVDDPVERRVATVGTIRPHTEVKIIDAEGRVVPPGTAGELCTRGYNVMLGYWDDPELTARAIDHAGWMHTGDLAKLDEDGYANIVGGLKDMVIRGGENVYVAEVEEFLGGHPAIAEVIVVGVPDRRLGEELCACIRPAPGETLDAERLRDFCSGDIAHYKVPRYVHCVERFPASSGAALRFLLRQQAMAALGIEG